DIVRGMGNPRILVVGDLILDRYVFGTVDRISPEAPIGVLHASDEETRLGGAGSAARNLAVLGARVVLLGFLGEGEDGDEFLRLAKTAGIEAGGIVRAGKRPTSRKTRLIALNRSGGQQVLRVDREETGPYPEKAAAALRKAALDSIAESDLLVLSDYAKGTLDASLVTKLIEAGRKAGVRVVVDPKPPHFARYRGATVITPNRPEASAFAGFPVLGPEEADRAARKITEDLDLEAAVVKLDRHGMYLAERGGAAAFFPVVPREVFDVTGAGDMVIAAIAMVLAAGGSYPDAVRIANVAAGIEVSRLGVVAVSPEEILEALYTEATGPAGKCRELPELLEILAARRQRGEKIVFTNGCFDVLHAGHVRLLTAARAEGDALVVGLNSDASVRRLKGEGRPVTEERERAEMLSSLTCVDHVVIFPEETPLEVVEEIVPDVIVKGEDWREKGVVGREVVEAAGGKVVLVPLVPGLSSTALIEKLREREP
ncbi:MAG: D-glycero-beta-D-manno-heptose 1-phosphate adenylyltransferase, partial [Planctomycetota bacterium]